MRLDSSFYKRDGLTLAKDLLGKLLVREVAGERIVTTIVETEAYLGPRDKACHAYDNKRTKRTEVMFWEGGRAYVYLIYGMYNCFNVVASKEGIPEAVLIRAAEPLQGLETIKKNRSIKSKKIEDLTNGPGKLCQALQIDRELNGYDMVSGDEIYILDSDEKVEVVADKRINIDYAQEYKDKEWRFYIEGNSFVSR
ncbi:DNA-3-methyladenine glycosylase [Halonatronum saccharophilum]|uniref:DNA-3-methyladenine glycosylase n=1 Tax=Halonatronum saccharophilum TaxID=150060 RepID=UPI0004868509|nr:DNA-3-methyladenine glycosylase [Halonatronum saccharophilum]